MKTALTIYLTIGSSAFLLFSLMNFMTPAISYESLVLDIAWNYFDKFYSAASFVAAAVGIALLDQRGARK